MQAACAKSVNSHGGRATCYPTLLDAIIISRPLSIASARAAVACATTQLTDGRQRQENLDGR